MKQGKRVAGGQHKDRPLAVHLLRMSLRAQTRQNIAPVAFDKAVLIGASRMQEEVGEAEVDVLLDELDVSFQKKLAEQRWVAES